jgi:DNA-binding response OmpR family regulator
MSKWRVLLVDDEPSILKVVGKRLTLAGYEVMTAVDGQDALERVRANPPHLILLDLMMPRCSGFEACRELKQDERYRDIPVIIFTGKGGDMDEKVCRELGADAYISKSWGTEALMAQVEALLVKTAQDGEAAPSTAS